MSIHPKPINAVPENAARAAGKSFSKETTHGQMHYVLGVIYDKEDLMQSFRVRGGGASVPRMLVLDKRVQFDEGHCGRQAGCPYPHTSEVCVRPEPAVPRASISG